jgi:hypothetical protein
MGSNHVTARAPGKRRTATNRVAHRRSGQLLAPEAHLKEEGGDPMQLRRAAMAVVTVVTVGCASIHTRSEVAPETNLGRYRTFGWLPPFNGEEPLTIVDQQVRGALRKQLMQKGLVEATGGPPDFLVGYHVIQERKVAVTDWGNGLYGWGPQEMPYTDGTLVVDFVDPTSNQVIWRGQATGAVEHPGAINVKRLEKAVAMMIRRYPYHVASAAPPRM